MINIHLTGAKAAYGTQPYPNLSTGGYLAASKMSENINNLFPEYSLNEMVNESVVIRGVVIKNITNQILENVGVGVLRAPDEKCRIWLAVVELNNDAMEVLVNDKFDPSSAIFYELYMENEADVENLLYIGDFTVNKTYGLWIKKQLSNEYAEVGDYCQAYAETEKESGFELIFKTDTEPEECDCEGGDGHGEIIVQFKVQEDFITTYQNNKLKDNPNIIVAREGFTMYRGTEDGEYQLDSVSGTITFNSRVYNGERILIFKL